MEFVPEIEVTRHDDRLIVKVDLPGLSAGDVQVAVVDGSLVVTGERHREHEDDGVIRCERAYGVFRRTIPLPEGSDVLSAEAHFDRGVLEVSLRTPPKDPGRRIEIQTTH